MRYVGAGLPRPASLVNGVEVGVGRDWAEHVRGGGTVAGNGGTGGSGELVRSSGLYPIAAAFPVSEADSLMADDWVVVRVNGGLPSNSRFGRVGCLSVAVEFERVYGGKVVSVVLRDKVVTVGPLSRSGRVGFESSLARLG